MVLMLKFVSYDWMLPVLYHFTKTTNFPYSAALSFLFDYRGSEVQVPKKLGRCAKHKSKQNAMILQISQTHVLFPLEHIRC